MMDADPEARSIATDEPILTQQVMTDLSLDPFAFHGHPASCIEGLGGNAPLPDPSYAFHTDYVPVARGRAHFRVKLHGLHGRRGTLLLRVHMLPAAAGAPARMVTSQRVQLNWLAHHGGEISLRFEAFRGATYALMGLVPDQSDARADAIEVVLDRPASEADLAGPSDAAEAQGTAFGSKTLRSVSLLVSRDAPVFAQPVSQPATQRQLRERDFRRWCDRAPERIDRTAEGWQSAFVLQALERYGLLTPGAAGLALGKGAEGVCALLQADGIACRTAPMPALDMTDGPESLPDELFGLDFLFSIRATDAAAETARATAAIEKAMEALRPGGLAVHIVGYGTGTGVPLGFDRNQIERIALGLISRGHEVARLKPANDERLASTDDRLVPFGIIARRAQIVI